MKAVGYIRVSTNAQAEDDKFGISSQKEIIEKYAKDNGYELVDIYVEEGVSGVKETRPELDKILYGEAEVDYDTVIVAKSDRIARDIKLYFYYLYTLEKKGVKLVSVAETFDDELGLGNVYRSILLFVAEQERKNICARTSGGRNIKARSGGYSGGGVPYSYIAKDGKLEVNEQERPIIELVFKELELGISYGKICKDLSAEGYRTRKGSEFTPSNIQSIKNNLKVYQGYYKYGDNDYVKGQHQALIDL